MNIDPDGQIFKEIYQGFKNGIGRPYFETDAQKMVRLHNQYQIKYENGAGLLPKPSFWSSADKQVVEDVKNMIKNTKLGEVITSDYVGDLQKRNALPEDLQYEATRNAEKKARQTAAGLAEDALGKTISVIPGAAVGKLAAEGSQIVASKDKEKVAEKTKEVVRDKAFEELKKMLR